MPAPTPHESPRAAVPPPLPAPRVRRVPVGVWAVLDTLWLPASIVGPYAFFWWWPGPFENPHLQVWFFPLALGAAVSYWLRPD